MFMHKRYNGIIGNFFKCREIGIRYPDVGVSECIVKNERIIIALYNTVVNTIFVFYDFLHNVDV